MSEIQKNNITKLLKENGKSKRELAAFLDIHENGINRLLGNPNISKLRLEQIADFLKVDITVLLKNVYSFTPEIKTNGLNSKEFDFERVSDYNVNEEMILLLSEIIRGQKTIREVEEKNGELMTKIMNLIVKSSGK
jgi:transcriptional regulator with XRE-family HTH domain